MTKTVEVYKSKLTGERFIRDGNSYKRLDGTKVSSLQFQNGELVYVMTGTLHKSKPQIK